MGSVATGYKNCASNAADTGGDNNGYQTNAGNACALDNTRARDINSGTTNSLVCTDPGQDRHRFWGYAFGLPGSISAIHGIQVQPTVEVNNNGGSSLICVQLSWDGGASWTATKQVNVTNSLTTYTLGIRDRHLGPHMDAGAAQHDQLPRPDHRRVQHVGQGLRPRRHPGPGQLHPVDSGG